MGKYEGELRSVAKTVRLTETVYNYIENFPKGDNFNNRLENLVLHVRDTEDERRKEIESLDRKIRELAAEKRALQDDIAKLREGTAVLSSALEHLKRFNTLFGVQEQTPDTRVPGTAQISRISFQEDSNIVPLRTRFNDRSGRDHLETDTTNIHLKSIRFYQPAQKEDNMILEDKYAGFEKSEMSELILYMRQRELTNKLADISKLEMNLTQEDNTFDYCDNERFSISKELNKMMSEYQVPKDDFSALLKKNHITTSLDYRLSTSFNEENGHYNELRNDAWEKEKATLYKQQASPEMDVVDEWKAKFDEGITKHDFSVTKELNNIAAEADVPKIRQMAQKLSDVFYDRVCEDIAGDIRKSGHLPDQKTVNKIYSLEQMKGGRLTITNLRNMYSEKKYESPTEKELVEGIGQTFKEQELAERVTDASRQPIGMEG